MSTIVNGLPVPALPDPPNIPAAFQAFALASITGQLYQIPVASSTVQPITTTGNNYTVGGTSTQVTLTSARKLRIVTQVDVTSATAVGQFNIRVGVNQSAFDITNVTAFDHGTTRWTQVVGSTGYESFWVEAANQFSAGTWIFYPVIRRLTGGTGSDSATSGLISVYDAGPV